MEKVRVPCPARSDKTCKHCGGSGFLWVSPQAAALSAMLTAITKK